MILEVGEWAIRKALADHPERKLIDFGKQVEVPMRDLMFEYLHFVDDVVDELGSRNEINYVYKMLQNGSGADRQLRVFRETGDLKKVSTILFPKLRPAYLALPLPRRWLRYEFRESFFRP